MKRGLKGILFSIGLVLCVIVLMSVFACAAPAPKATTTPTPTATPTKPAATTPTVAPSPTTTAAPKPAPTTATAAGPKRGGIIKIINVGDSIDNLGVPMVSVPRSNAVAGLPALDKLFIYDDRGFPTPYLATGYTWGAGKLSLTINLPKGVKYHDGTDFNAQSVKWQLDVHRVGPRPELKNVTSIDVVDDYSVRLNLSSFDTLLLSDIAKSAGSMISPTTFKAKGENWAITNAVGVGPFKQTSFERSVGVKFERFDGYRQAGKPYLDGIQIMLVADATTAKASFLAGEGQVMMGAVSPVIADDLKKTGKYNVISNPSSIVGLAGDSLHPDSPFGNLKVRQAVSAAIDSKAICAALGYGFWQPANQHAYSSLWSYNPNVAGYPFNPQKAKDLLKEAGYATGFKTKITFTAGTSELLCTAVQRYLKDVGIDAALDAVTSSKFTLVTSQGWTNGLVLYSGLVPVGYPPMSTLRRQLSDQSALYVSIIHPKEYQDLLNATLVQPDEKTMIAMGQELNKMIIDTYCLINPIYASSLLCVSYPEVKGLRIYDPWWDIFIPADGWLNK